MIILLDEAENDMKNYAVQGGIIGRWITTSEIICIILHILKAGWLGCSLAVSSSLHMQNASGFVNMLL